MTGDILAPILTFCIAAGVLTVTPGVDTALVLRSAAARGPQAGAAAAIGIAAGLLLWGAAAAFGLTAVLAASELGFTVLKWAGAGYLGFLGLKLIARPRAALNESDAASPVGRRAADALRRGFLTNMLNPKVGVFYVSFLPQFIPHGANVVAFSLLLAGVHVLLTSAWFTLLIGMTVPLGQLLRRPGVVRTLDRLTGCVFVAFGAKLAFSQRS